MCMMLQFWYGANFHWVYLGFGFPPHSTFKLDRRKLCPWQTFQSLSWFNSSSLASKFMWEWPTIYYYILCQPSKTSDTQSQIPCQHCRVLVEISNTITGGLRWSTLQQEEVLLKSVITFLFWVGVVLGMICNLALLAFWGLLSCYKCMLWLLVMFTVFAAKQWYCRWHAYGNGVETLVRISWHQTMPCSFYCLWLCKIIFHFSSKNHYSECCIVVFL